MELREPRRKRRVSVKCQQPFPVPIKSFSEEVFFNGVQRIYKGQYAGFNAIVSNPEDMTALHSMGFFGKGSLSRSVPTFGKWKMDTPPLIFNRQWKRRCDWAKTGRILNSDDSQILVRNEVRSSGEGKCNSLEIGGVSESTKKATGVAVKKEIKTEVIDLDDDIIMIENVNSEAFENSNKQMSSVEVRQNTHDTVKEEPENESKAEDIKFSCSGTVDVDSKQGQSVIVLADSDCDSGDEDYLLNLNPRLEQEEFPIQESLQLSLEEAFFLSYGLGCLNISDMFGNDLQISELWKLFQESQSDFVEKYVVYHYYRSKGWIVKPGIKFGGDFLLYKQGPAFYHASYIVHTNVVSIGGLFNLEDKRSLHWTQYIGLNRLAETAGKEILLCNVVWPLDVSRSEILSSPKVLKKFTVHEVLLRRWVSSQEREELEKEDIMD